MISKFIFLILGLLTASMYPIGIEPVEKYSAGNALTQTAILLTAYMLAGFLAYFFIRHRTHSYGHIRQKMHLLAVIYQFLLLAIYAYILFYLNWPLLWRVDFYTSFPGAEVFLTYLPFLTGTVMAMVPTYYMERHLRGEQPGLGVYMGFSLRSVILTALIPVFLMNSIMEYLGGFRTIFFSFYLYPYMEWLVLTLLFLLMFYISPFFMRLLWQTKPLTDPALRRRLEELCTRAGIPCRYFYVWNTRCGILNAAVAGISGSTRHIFITDAMLEKFSEYRIHAVVAHEIGHAKKFHIAKYMLLFFSSLFAVMAVSSAWPDDPILSLVLPLFMMFFWLVIFSGVSRRFEAEADLYAVELTGDPGLFTTTLEYLAELSGGIRNVPSITHSSIANRVNFIWLATLFPQKKAWFKAHMKRVTAAILSAFIAGFAGAVFILAGESGSSDKKFTQLYHRDIFMLSLDMLGRGMPDEGTKLLKELAAKYPENAQYFLILADTYLEGNNIEEGLEYLEYARLLMPKEPELRYYLHDLCKKYSLRIMQKNMRKT